MEETHFAHSKGTDCPLIEENHDRYVLLSPSTIDASNGYILIRWAKVNSFHLYNKCKEILDGKLKFQEFSDMLDKAYEKNIWFYKGLTQKTLPYVLIVNHGKFTKNSGIRSDEFHFIFDKDLYGDDLFLQKEITHLWRIDSNLDIEKIEIDYDIQGTAPDYFWNYINQFINR